MSTIYRKQGRRYVPVPELHLDEILQVRGLMVSDVRRALQGGLVA